MILKPITIWITGLSASGKTTLGQRLFDDLMGRGIHNVEFLDGEVVRDKIGKMHEGFLTKDRNTLNMYKADLALKSNKMGNIAIVTSISHTREIRAKVREHIGNFIEVYLKCSVDVCSKRDYKGHYKKAFTGKLDNFVGVTEPYEESENVEMILDTSYKSIEDCSKVLLEASLDFIYGRVGEKLFD